MDEFESVVGAGSADEPKEATELSVDYNVNTGSEQNDNSEVSEDDFVKPRAVLRRRFTMLRSTLEKELGKRTPSLRYLKKNLDEAEAVVQDLEKVVDGHRQFLVQKHDDDRLEVLNKWEEKFVEEQSLLADVSAFVENTTRHGNDSVAMSERRVSTRSQSPPDHAWRDLDGSGGRDADVNVFPSFPSLSLARPGMLAMRSTRASSVRHSPVRNIGSSPVGVSSGSVLHARPKSVPVPAAQPLNVMVSQAPGASVPAASRPSVLQSAVHAPTFQPVFQRSKLSTLPALPVWSSALPALSSAANVSTGIAGSAYIPQSHVPVASHQSAFAAVPQPQRQYGGGLQAPGGLMPQSTYIPSHQLHRPLEFPKFSGKGQEYVRWKQRFLQFMDPHTPPEYQMARLREAVQNGEAEELIADFLDGPGAYSAAWAELESWYGGTDRHLEQQLRELMNHPRIVSDRDVDGLQKYAIKLRSILANMKTVGQVPGTELCIVATEKIPKSLLVRYFESHGNGNTDVEAFSQWLLNRLKTLRYANDRSDYTSKTSQPRDVKLQAKSAIGQRTMTSNDTRSIPQQHEEEPQFQTTRTACRKCNGNHRIADCKEFKSLNVSKRWDLIRLLSLCACCLQSGHWARDCQAAECAKCKKRHHSLLHHEPKTEKEHQSKSTMPKQNSDRSHVTLETHVQPPKKGVVAFMTAEAEVFSEKCTANATLMLDSASSCSYVTKKLAEQLMLQGVCRTMRTVVLGGKVVQGERQFVSFDIRHADGINSTLVEAWVLNEITTDLEPVDWKREWKEWPHLSGVPLPRAGSRHTVDILVGLDAPHLHTSLEDRSSNEGGPIARRTVLGWLCFGEVTGDSRLSNICNLAMGVNNTLDDVVKRFWDLEAVGMLPVSQTYNTPEEKMAESTTVRTLRHDGTRFEVGVPWRSEADQPVVSCKKSLASQRLHSLHRLFNRKPDVKVKYTKVLESYLEKSYIRLVKNEDVIADGENQWFLPHFPVVRENRTTTKVRIVFDGSAKLDGVAINDLMYTGPKLQNDLVHILLRFCNKPIAIAADISEMFLQVKLRHTDRKYHRFLWQSSPGEPMVTYEFCRLVFGIRASPYLAGRALKATAEQFGTNTTVQQVIDKDFYVDDLLHSANNVEQAKIVRQETQSVLYRGGFRLRKWISNSPGVMESIPEDERAETLALTIQDPDATSVASKMLGVSWLASSDVFEYNYSEPEPFEITRRGVLSQMCRVFDPRGHLAPFTIRSRVMFQESCLREQSWDTFLDDDQQVQWKKWFSEFPELSSIRIDRCFSDSECEQPFSLHTFTDASESAYAAVTYVRQTLPSGDAKVTLAMAKARPVPMKRKTIPMLELQGGVLGVRVSSSVAAALDIPKTDCHFWTDSMNVLYWVRSPSRKFKIEVGNRISEIQQLSDTGNWRHVPGKQNPADKPTRGSTVKTLAADDNWWHGPEFLARSEATWPEKTIIVPRELPGQIQRPRADMTFATREYSAEVSRLHPDHYSCWKRLIRVTAWCRRFISSARAKKIVNQDSTTAEFTSPVQVKDGLTVHVRELSAEEIQREERHWILTAQRDVYGDTLDTLRQGKVTTPHDPLRKLNPGLSQEKPQLLVVQGRLDASPFPLGVRRPIILPQKHRVTELIIAVADQKCGHEMGTGYVWAQLAENYWVVRGRSAIKAFRNKCHACRRKRGKPTQQLMGQLPAPRVENSMEVFSNVGLDYAGPFFTKQGRGKSKAKRYLCLFTCLETRACHLEMAYSMTTEGFLMCFSRFQKRRGTPRHLVSDNGSNFRSADAELRDAVKSLENGKIAAVLATQQILWSFNPPHGPHHGGVFEALIKTAKRAMNAVLRDANCTDEELHTAIVEAEGLMNSRPLTAVTTDAEDPSPLTPAHFLVGRSVVPTPLEAEADSLDRVHPERRWRVIQLLVRNIWRRWLKELVPLLNVRCKWLQNGKNMKIGDIVLYMEANTPRASWPLARVHEVYPGQDGRVRVVDIRLKGKVYRRPISVLVPLECEPLEP